MISSCSLGSPPYVIRSPSSAARSPETMTSPARSSSGSKSTSQIHETSCPSAIASLSATTSTGGTPVSSVRTTSFAPAGFLIEEEDDRLAAGRDPLEAAERRAEALEPGADVLERRADRERERGGRDRVVDVVEARAARSSTRVVAGRRHEVEPRRLQPTELDVARGDVELGAAVAARRTAVVAEVTDVRGGEDVRRAAAHAVLRVGRVLQLRAGMSWVVDAEANRTAACPSARSATTASSALTTNVVSGGIVATAARQRSATISSSP